MDNMSAIGATSQTPWSSRNIGKIVINGIKYINCLVQPKNNAVFPRPVDWKNAADIIIIGNSGNINI